MYCEEVRGLSVHLQVCVCCCWILKSCQSFKYWIQFCPAAQVWLHIIYTFIYLGEKKNQKQSNSCFLLLLLKPCRFVGFFKIKPYYYCSSYLPVKKKRKSKVTAVKVTFENDLACMLDHKEAIFLKPFI